MPSGTVHLYTCTLALDWSIAFIRTFLNATTKVEISEMLKCIEIESMLESHKKLLNAALKGFKNIIHF